LAVPSAADHDGDARRAGRQAGRGDDRARVDVGGPRAVGADARQQAVARFFDEALVGRRGQAHAERLRHVDDQGVGRPAAVAHDLDAARRLDLIARRGRGQRHGGGPRGGGRRRGRRLLDARDGERLAAAPIVRFHDRKRGEPDRDGGEP
jgi:hypothetical protein